MPNPEKGPQFDTVTDREIGEKDLEAEKMGAFSQELALQLKNEGIPVNNDCRINPEAFRGIYSENKLEKDKKYLEDKEKEFYKKELNQGLTLQEAKEQRKKTTGEKMEILTTAVLHKNLNKDFIVARSSPYDDIKNGVDNIIIEKETGNIICALDEVGDNFGIEYEKKKNNVLRRNIETNGAKLKYAFTTKKEKGKTILELKERKNIPIFYLALPEEYIKSILDNFQSSLSEQSDDEKKLFSYFLATLNSQVKALQLGYPHLHDKLKERLEYFDKSLKKFSPLH